MPSGISCLLAFASDRPLPASLKSVPENLSKFLAEPLPASEEALAGVTYNSDGLVPAIVQEADTGQVLMMAWMNEESLRLTFQSGRMWYWSRSRRELWCKGETSGDRQYVREAFYDCDGDTLLFKIDQEGKGACHTGEWSCFFRSFAP